MGRRWQEFKDKCEAMVESVLSPETSTEPEPAPTPSVPMRAYRQEPLNEYQRRDLLELVNSPGYEVLLDLHESTLEGFITSLVETPAEKQDEVLALHKLVHAGYLYNRSVQQQVETYRQIEEGRFAEAQELKDELARQAADPLSDETTFNKVLNPIYVPEAKPPKPLRPATRVRETPLDKMLKSSM